MKGHLTLGWIRQNLRKKKLKNLNIRNLKLGIKLKIKGQLKFIYVASCRLLFFFFPNGLEGLSITPTRNL